MKRAVLTGGIACAVAGGVAYEKVVRPWHLRWGATDEEVRRAMPGDDQVPDPVLVSTKAVTVDALPSTIWPWLAQMGYRRGGLYSYDFLDRCFGYIDRPSADTVHEEWQDIHIGSTIPLGRGPSWPVTAVEPERFLVLTPVHERRTAVTWAFGLYPIDRFSTRLVSRVRARYPTGPHLYPATTALDLAAFVMTRRMLLNLKDRAEHLSHQRIAVGEIPTIAVPLPARPRRRVPVGVG